MPEIENQTPESEAAEQPAVQDEPGSSLKTKLKFLVFAVTVVIVECLAAYLCIPTTPDTAAMASPADEVAPSTDPLFAENEQNKGILEELAEVDLGEFTVTSYQPVSGTTLRIDFHLFGTVAAKDAGDFNLAMQENLHRIRDQVIVILRSSELEDVTDAGLGLIKRKISEKTNQSLGKPYLQAVVFSDFSFIEQ
jgi:flagellar FliL protein